MLSMLAAGTLHFNPLNFLIGFLILVCVIAVVIIGIRYLISLTGWVIPAPLLAMGGIILFIVLLLVLLNYSGLYVW